MAVIFGLDLHELQWSKFGNTWMWKNRDYHLRRTKLIVYQLAMICCVVSESIGTAALTDYINQEDYVKQLGRDAGLPDGDAAQIHNNAFVGLFSYNIFVGVYVAFIFGSAFFFDLIWPERHEDHGIKVAWKACGLFACAFTLSAALGCTILVAIGHASISGVDRVEAKRLLEQSRPNESLVYKDNGRAIASVVFLWPGFVFTVFSTFLLWHSIDHIDRYGPFSQHVRRDRREKDRSVRSAAAVERREQSLSTPAATAAATDDAAAPPAVAAAPAAGAPIVDEKTDAPRPVTPSTSRAPPSVQGSMGASPGSITAASNRVSMDGDGRSKLHKKGLSS